MAEQHDLVINIKATNSQAVGTLNQTKRSLDDLDKSAERVGDGLDGASSGASGMGMALAGIGWAGAIASAGAFVAQLNEVGRASAVAQNVFGVMVGDIDASLATLRESTRGMVDDATLMQGVNLLLKTGIAENVEQASDLIQLATDLGQSVEEFALTLSNQSYERLDTLGISAGKVRERVQELKAEFGMSTESAFSQAVLELGGALQDKLAPAIEANISAVAQLQTRFTNAIAEMGQSVNAFVEGGAGIVEGLLSEKDFTANIVRQVESLYGQGQLDLNFGVLANSTSDVLYYAEQVANRVYESGSATKALVDIQTLLNTEYQNGNRDLENQVVILEALVDLKRQELVQQQSVNQLQSLAIAERQEQQRQTDAMIMRSLTSTDAYASAIDRLKDLSSGLVPVGEIENAESLARNLTHQIDELLSRDENNPTLKTLETMRGQLEGIAESARRAYDEMGLATALGLGLDPSQQLTSDILARAGIGGRQAEYLTGERTQLSELFDMNITPLLEGVQAQFGEDEAARLGDRIAKLLKEGIEGGLQNNPTDLIQFVMSNAGYSLDSSGDARSVIVQAGETLTSIAQREGVTVELLAEINQLANPNMILAGQELVIDVTARVTRVLPVGADETGLSQSTLDMIYTEAPTTTVGEKEVPVYSPEALGLDQSLQIATDMKTIITETEAPLLTPDRFGLVSGEVAETGTLETANMVQAVLDGIASKLYRVNMTVDLDARIRTGAGFKIIPITMTEIAEDIREANKVFLR